MAYGTREHNRTGQYIIIISKSQKSTNSHPYDILSVSIDVFDQNYTCFYPYCLAENRTSYESGTLKYYPQSKHILFSKWCYNDQIQSKVIVQSYLSRVIPWDLVSTVKHLEHLQAANECGIFSNLSSLTHPIWWRCLRTIQRSMRRIRIYVMG